MTRRELFARTIGAVVAALASPALLSLAPETPVRPIIDEAFLNQIRERYVVAAAAEIARRADAALDLQFYAGSQWGPHHS